MKAHLLYRDRDFDPSQSSPPGHDALSQDLELTTLVDAMSRQDKFQAKIASKVLLASTADLDTIEYRQAILGDCMDQEAVIREMYDLIVETIATERKNHFWYSFSTPGSTLHSAIRALEILMERLRRLRDMADQHGFDFRSEGFRNLFAMLRRELDDSYFAAVRDQLKHLQFNRGVLISARLGEGNKGADYVLRKANPPEGTWFDRLFESGPPTYSFQLADRDEAGARALSELKDRGLSLVANALAQSTDHILGFFQMLQTELAFYVGCLNLRETLHALGASLCFPRAAAETERRHRAEGLYDVCLTLRKHQRIFGNVIAADGKDLVIITGANQGGKSTFLRSAGLAQIMMQCGMFVPAEEFEANVCRLIFTHYKREEDASMTSGKFDEELGRMNEIVNHLKPDSLVLFNESFAATNEREGSEIAQQIVLALVERRVKVFFVTHQYAFASSLRGRELPNALFLRAQRLADGSRTYQLTPGEPLPTSFGQDLYREIFGEAAA